MNAFDSLSLAHKLKTVKVKGEFLATIGHSDYSVSLYRIERTIVERYFDNATNKTIRVSSARYVDLIKYLPYISISSIYTLIAQ